MASLHITNGSCAGDLLNTFVDRPVVLACDVLHEGPAPRVDDETWYAVRAGFLCRKDGTNLEEIRSGLAAVDRDVRSAVARGDEVVLWFEHDLFDQLELIRMLDLIARAAGGAIRADRVCMVCIDRFPGVDRFIGLGQLDAAQLASLYPLRRSVAEDQIAIASAAWDAFRSPDPRALVDIAAQATADDGSRRALPFLGEALFRLLAEYPSAENGLTQTESLALQALQKSPLTAGALFAGAQRREPRPFMGDSTFFDVVSALASGRVPLVSIEGPRDRPDLRPHTIALLDAGRDVLAGRADRVALNGIDVWRGGVHLTGVDRSPWRWDGRSKTLVS